MLCAAGCGASGQTGSCMPVPQTFPQNRLVASGATIHAPVGALLWVALAEPANLSDTGYPRSFPWLTPTSSDQSVLTAVRLCPLQGTLPEKITAFRAVGHGDAILLAELAPPWRGRTHAPPSYRAAVVIQR
jgi:hypothetical protein